MSQTRKDSALSPQYVIEVWKDYVVVMKEETTNLNGIGMDVLHVLVYRNASDNDGGRVHVGYYRL